MVLAIISFVFEMLFLSLAYIVNNDSFSIAAIVVLIICTLISFICLISNAISVKYSESKGRHVTGLIFSIVGTIIGVIFTITFFAALKTLR